MPPGYVSCPGGILRIQGRAVTKSNPNRKILFGFVGVLALAAIAYGSYRFGETAGHSGLSVPAAQEQPFTHAPQPSLWVKTESFGPWDIKCRKSEKAAQQKLCVAVLEVVETKSQQTLLAWLVGYDGAGKLTTTLHTLSGVQVARGLDLELEGTPVRHLAYGACAPRGCDASTPMDSAFLKAALKTESAKVTIYSIEDKVLNFDIPIGGLDKAIDALRP